MATTPAVLFSQGSSTRFPDIPKDPNTLYFLKDTKEIYLGPDRYGFGKDTTVVLTGSGDCVADIAWDISTKTLTITKGSAGDAVSVRELLDAALEDYVKGVTAPRDSAINIDNTDPQNPVVDIQFADGVPEEGNVKFGQCSEGLYANVELPEIPVTGVAADDQIISLNGSILKSTLHITTIKEDDNTFIALTGINGDVISRFKANDFIRHGVLKSAALAYEGNPPEPILVLTFITSQEGVEGETVIKVNVKDLVDLYVAKEGGGLSISNNNEFYITNETTASSGVNSDVTLGFGTTVPLNTIMYDSHGCITGQKTFNVTIPGLTGNVGSADNSKIVTFIGLSSDGQLIGNSVDIVNTLSASSTDTQIPTAKAVFDTIEDAMAVWTTFD